MPSRAAVLDMLENQQPQIRRVPDVVATTAALTLTYNAHAGKVIKSTAAGVTVTLPLATTAKSGETYTLIVASLNTATSDTALAVTSLDTINGGTSGLGLVSEGSMDALGDFVSVVSDGTGWYTTARFGTWKAE